MDASEPVDLTPPKKGDDIDQLWRVVKGLVLRVNALSHMEVSPNSAGKFTYADGNVKLELKTKKCPPPA